VESEVGKGSIFTFTLPVSEGERRNSYFRFILDKEFRRAQENHTPLTLFLIKVFDEPGELKDTLLAQLEDQVKQCLCRKADMVLRREKEKIVAALCEADLRGARVIRKRIEDLVQKHPIQRYGPPPTLKVGTATYPEEALSKRNLFGKAKERLGG
jgi:GGDEF domain-containing protein